MEYEILDEPQGEPEYYDARRDGGIRDHGTKRSSKAPPQPGEPIARESRRHSADHQFA